MILRAKGTQDMDLIVDPDSTFFKVRAVSSSCSA